jgi:hypothetical protein
MAIWLTVDNAIEESFRGRNYFANTTAGAYKLVLVKAGTLDTTNVTIGDFINCGTNTEANYTRPTLTSVTLDTGTAGKPLWKAANVNITAAAELQCNYVAIVAEWTGSDDSDKNIVCISNIGAQTVSDTTNLVLDFSAGILQGDDPATA